jgi:chitodextrinase
VKEQWGDNITWNDYQPEGLDYTSGGAVSLDVSEERWYNITIRVAINSFTNGQPNHDGLMEGFVDGKLVSSIRDLYLLTASDINKGVSRITMGHFFGGNDNRFGPLRDEWTLFDDFICFTYDESLNVPRGNTPSQPGRVLQLPNLKTEQPVEQDLTPPSVPQGLRATKVTGSNVHLVWEASQDNTAVKGYRIFLNGHRTGISDVNSYVISGLDQNTTYSIAVSAYDASSNESARSEAIFATTLELDTIAPPVPTGLRVTGSTESSIRISWDEMPGNTDIEAFNVYLDGEIAGTTDVGEFELLNLQADTEYTIFLTSFDASNNESEQSDQVRARTDAPDLKPPTVPTGLMTTGLTENSISLSWNSSSDNVGVSGYRIYMNGVVVDTSTATLHTLTGLKPGVNYSISVSAFDFASNESGHSDEIFISTENPDNVSTPQLPAVRIVDFANNVQGNVATAVSEVESIGHTELLDYGLMIVKEGSDPELTPRTVYYAEKQNSLLTHSSRVKKGIQLMYDFTEGEGGIVRDKSGSDNSVDLMINNPLVTSWLPGQGLKIDNSTLISSQEVPMGMLNSISSSNEITLESWIRTGASDQSGPARILSISRDSKNRVATIGQSGDNDSYNYIARLTTTETSLNGTPEVTSNEVYNTPNLHHVVYTRSKEGIERIHINGEEKYSGMREGNISVGEEGNYLALANEMSGERPWIGSYYLVAVYDQALSEKDIAQNYDAGTGVIKYSTNLEIEPNESYVVTPFARTIQGIAYGDPVVLNANNFLHGIKEDSISMTIYPNPSNGDFTINVKCNVENTQMAYLQVSDMMGQILHNERLSVSELCGEEQFTNGGSTGIISTGQDIHVALSSLLEDGIYLVTVIVGNQSAGRRLLIQH